MGYSDRFKSRMERRGLSAFDRAMNAKQRQFELYFESTLNKELVEIDGVPEYATFQDQNQNNNKDMSDDKYMIVRKESVIKSGSYVKWRGNMWIVFMEENKTVPTHRQVKIKQMNATIRWMIGDKICRNGEGYPAYVQNNTLYTLGVATSGQNIWAVNAKFGMYMQDTNESRGLKIGSRVFIGGNVYKVLFKDYTARRGVISFLLEEDFVNPSKDNIELQIADYYPAVNQDKEPESTGVSKEVTINGSSTAKIGSLVKYEAKVFQDGKELQADITDWTIDDTERVATVVEQSPTGITLRIENNFKKVGSIISVIGKTSDGVFGSETVRIISPY